MLMDDEGLSYDQIMDLINKRDEEENKDRRKKKSDLVIRMSNILNLGAWAIMLAVWAVIDRAAPQKGMMMINTFFDVHFGVAGQGRTGWDRSLIYTAYLMMLFSLGSCLIAFVLNLMRRKRKNDKLRISIIFISVITIVVFVIFLLNFWRYLF